MAAVAAVAVGALVNEGKAVAFFGPSDRVRVCSAARAIVGEGDMVLNHHARGDPDFSDVGCEPNCLSGRGPGGATTTQPPGMK